VERNAHCLGLLRAEGEPGEQEHCAVLQRLCRIAATQLFGVPVRRRPGRRFPDHVPGHAGFVPEGDVARWHRVELEDIFQRLWEALLDDHPMGSLLFADLSEDDGDAAVTLQLVRCTARMQHIHARNAAAAAAGGIAPGQLRLFPTPWPSPHDVPPGALQASVAQLHVSRASQCSCPVQSGALLLGAAPLRDDDPACGSAAWRAALAARVDDAPMLRALDDVTDLETLREVCASGALPRIINVGNSPAGTWAEFEPRGRAISPASPPGALWPVAWFAFTPRAEAEARATAEDAAATAAIEAAAGRGDIAPELPDEDRFDVLDIELQARHGGDLVCVKLISSENLMAQWGDDSRPGPNIDIAAVELRGFAATHEG